MTHDHGTGLNAAVAAELRAEKARQGLTNEAISGRSGIPVVTVQRLMAATRAIDVRTLELIAQAMDADPVAILAAAAKRHQDPPYSSTG